MDMRNRKKTVQAEMGTKHTMVVYADEKLWDDFERLRVYERISTRSKAFRLMMKRAVLEMKIELPT